MLRVVTPFTYKNRDYVRGDDVALSEFDVINTTPRLRKKCVAIADKAPVEDLAPIAPIAPIAPEEKE